MIRYVFIVLVVLLGYALVLLVPMNSALTLVLIGAIIALGVIVFMLYMKIREILWWILGRPMGNGTSTVGVDEWIKNRSFQKGSGSGDPDGAKPIDPPPAQL